MLKASIATFFCFTAFAIADHPNLNQAADALRKANTTHNLEDLQEAKRRVHAAAAAKDVTAPLLRKEALRNVNEALEALKTGDRVQSDKHIAEALKNIEQIIARGKGK